MNPPQQTAIPELKPARKRGWLKWKPRKTADGAQVREPNLTLDAANAIVEGTFAGKSLATISAASGLSEAKSLKLIRGVKVPEDYPTTEDAWRADVLDFMRIAIWKGTRRLANEGMEEMPTAQIPVSTAIMVDKFSLMSGAPTSLSLTAHVTLKQSDLQDRLARLKQTLTPPTDV